MDDVREAAERLRRIQRGDRVLEVYENRYMPIEEQYRVDLETVYDAEHPADDGEPVTKDWLGSVGFALSFDKPFTSLGDGFYLVVTAFGRAAIEKRDSLSRLREVRLRDCKTRGDVRRLCKALGVELSE